jgi:hypothetical protein
MQALATEIARQTKVRRDFLADTREVVVVPDGDRLGLRINGHGQFVIRETGHEQIAERLGIPQRFYDRLKGQHAPLLADLATGLFHRAPERRMIRTLDDGVRALLSERYRPLDNVDLMEAVLPALMKAGMRIESCEVTERRLYLKAVTERVQAKITGGHTPMDDILQAGLVVSNSEIGQGSVRVDPMVWRQICSNGAIVADAGFRKYHVGRPQGGDEGGEGGAWEFFSDETKRVTDAALWAQVRDVAMAAVSEDRFAKIVERWQAATVRQIEASPVKAVEVLAARTGLTEPERDGVLAALIRDGDLSQYGLANAVTRYSQDVAEYERATALERLGGQVIELPRQDWEAISKAMAARN